MFQHSTQSRSETRCSCHQQARCENGSLRARWKPNANRCDVLQLSLRVDLPETSARDWQPFDFLESTEHRSLIVREEAVRSGGEKTSRKKPLSFSPYSFQHSLDRVRSSLTPRPAPTAREIQLFPLVTFHLFLPVKIVSIFAENVKRNELHALR